jgi:ferric-dicitrate binding protein FerR (iron transport regulator)
MRLQVLFQKYLDNQCSPAELEELVILLQQPEDEEQLTQLMQKAWLHAADKEPANKTDWQTMLSNIKQHKAELKPIRGKGSRLMSWLAAVAAVLLLVAGIWYLVPGKPAPQHTSKVMPAAEGTYTLVKATTDKQFVWLPDGSSVILNAGSSLRYNSRFAEDADTLREVSLEGEGYFDIKHDPVKPFVVIAGSLRTRVLGTAFNIRAYPSEEDIRVTVTRGRVQVINEHTDNLGVLAINEQIVYNTKGEAFTKKTVDAEKVANWKPSEMIFDDKTLAEVTEYLQARFDCQITIDNEEIRKRRVSATFYETDPLLQILEVVCAVTNTKYTQNGNRITVK